MAVSKLWSVTSRLGQVIDYAANPEKTAADIYTEEQYQALRDVLSYAKDEEKTECEFFVEGINCNPATARDQFVSVKKAYGKDDGIQAYHGYLSFKEQDISPELAQKIGMEFANEVWGKRFQVVVTTHLNTKHLHCHYVINSVSFVDGKRLWGDEKAWFKFRLVADRLCEKYGLYYNPNPNRSKQSSYYYKQEQAGMPSRYSITRDAIDEAIAHSTNLKTFAIAKGVITYGLELMLALFNIVQGTISTIMTSAGFGTPNQTTLPAEMVTTIESCGFFESIPLWAVTLIGGLFITVLSFIMIMTVYGRFFKLYMYTALAPIPLSTFAGEPSQNVGKSFIKSYCAVLLEGAVIVLACIIFSLFASTPPVVNPDAAAVTQVWAYIGELVFNMLVLVGAVKMSDRIIREMMGL